MMNHAQVLHFPTVESQLERKLSRLMELKAMASEYEALKKELKGVLEGTEATTIGRFSVKGKWVNQPEKTIKAFQYWDMRVSLAS